LRERIFAVIKRYLLLGLAPALIVILTPSFAEAQIGPADVTPLNNKDVMFMVAQRLEPEIIIKTIKSSPCTFDTFPPLMRDMSRRGVPRAVLQAMVEAPYGPSLASSSRDDAGEEPIYHYAEQLKQMGFLIPITSGRRLQTRQSRSRASRPRQKY
jgi:hypothetical protein